MKRKTLSEGWKFWKDGEELKQQVTLPHDAMLMEKRNPDIANGSGCAFFPGGKYYYETRLNQDATGGDGAAILEFEGVYQDSTILLNGEKVGGWYYGYTNFFVDLTDRLAPGENTITVIADNSHQPNSRWYTGSGIYRPVHLWAGDKVHFHPQGLLVKTVSFDPAVIEVQAMVTGAQTGDEVRYGIYDGGRLVAEGTSAFTTEAATAKLSQITGDSRKYQLTEPLRIEIPDAQLWSDEAPHLYTLRAKLCRDGASVDLAEEKFGIRRIDWNAEEGLLVNGRSVKLRGGCIHHDNGILGARTLRDAELRRIRRMKEFGFNAIRFSHCPAGKDLLDVCDEVGMYVLDESFDMWRRHKNPEDYAGHFDTDAVKDLTALAWKDYIHPSVIMYCIGNEIPDTGRDYGPEVARMMTGTLRSVDPTRPVTIANNAMMSLVSQLMQSFEKERGAEVGSLEINEMLTAHPEYLAQVQDNGQIAGKLAEIIGGVYDEVDIAGLNYGHQFYEGLHAARPGQLILSTETFPQQMASNWKMVSEHPWVIGDFQWTSWDYLGEAGVGVPVYGSAQAPFAKPYPTLTAGCGSFDLIGDPEAEAYYCAILWGAYHKPYIAVRPVDHSGEEYTVGQWRLTDAIDNWTWPGCEGRPAEIYIYSEGAEAELFRNGVSLGRKPLIDYAAAFTAAYESGMLMAVSYDADGKELARTSIASANSETRLSVQPETVSVPEGEVHEIFVPIRIVDNEGTLKRGTDLAVTVSVDGPAKLLVLGSGRQVTEELFDGNTHTSWNGSLLAILQTTGESGEIRVSASAAGVPDAEATI